MNNDQVKGDIKQAKGKVKEVAGRIFGDKSLENKGRIQNAAGKVQKSYGNLKEEIKSGK
ncbi:MAG TPA: CsbD family protein [Nevskia sp.]|nr:CsbD family protein [Nevskia sp.]